MAAGHWQSIREAADELGVAPETLTRRLRSGRPESSSAAADGAGVDAAFAQQQDDAPLPPPTGSSAPRPQPAAPATTVEQPQPLPRPPVCTLPPGKPLPPSGWVAPRSYPTMPPPTPMPLRRATDAAAIAAAAAASSAYVPPRDRIDDAFMAAVEEELKEIRSHRGQGYTVPTVVPAAPAG
jgi:hypothetical protein